jgi:uncharacterized protein (TIGR00369 family)
MPDYIWKEPARGGYPGSAVMGLSGLERLRAFVKGRLPAPPIQHLIGLRPVEVGIGTCTCLTPASPWLQTQIGMYTGGVGALAADAALGGAIGSGLEPWTGLVTSQLSMSFLRPAGPWSGRLSARGKLIHTTPTVGLSEVHVEDGEGRLLAHGTSRCFLRRVEPTETTESSSADAVAANYETPDPYLRPFDGALSSAGILEHMTGLEWIRAIINGDYPPAPIHLLIGYRAVEVDEGTATLVLPAHEWLCNAQAMVYGGVTAYMAHDAMAGAVHSTLPKATSFATLDLTVNFVRPIPADGGELRTRGRVFHRGRTFAVAGAEVLNADGKTVATGSGSWIILPGRPFPDQQDFAREFSSAAS